MAQNNLNEMTFEQLEAHIKNANLQQYDNLLVGPVTEDNWKEILKKICDIYKVIKPILTAVLKFPLIPPFIKTALETFMRVMDTICPA